MILSTGLAPKTLELQYIFASVLQ